MGTPTDYSDDQQLGPGNHCQVRRLVGHPHGRGLLRGHGSGPHGARRTYRPRGPCGHRLATARCQGEVGEGRHDRRRTEDPGTQPVPQPAQLGKSGYEGRPAGGGVRAVHSATKRVPARGAGPYVRSFAHHRNAEACWRVSNPSPSSSPSRSLLQNTSRPICMVT